MICEYELDTWSKNKTKKCKFEMKLFFHELVFEKKTNCKIVCITRKSIEIVHNFKTKDGFFVPPKDGKNLIAY